MNLGDSNSLFLGHEIDLEDGNGNLEIRLELLELEKNDFRTYFKIKIKEKCGRGQGSLEN